MKRAAGGYSVSAQRAVSVPALLVVVSLTSPISINHCEAECFSIINTLPCRGSTAQRINVWSPLTQEVS